MKFNSKQEKAFRAIDKNELVVLSLPEGEGKSFWLFWSIYRHLVKEPGTSALLLSPTYSGAISTFSNYCKEADGVFKKAHSMLLLPNGSRIILMGMDQYPKFASMEGYFVGIDNADLIDKNAFMRAYCRHRWPGLRSKVLATETRHPFYPEGAKVVA